jgi:subtilisin-like proprotein convertase family protein
MEHSFQGDINIRLQCYTPAGVLKEARLKNDHNDNSSYYLGVPIDASPNNSIPGVGWNYCWTESSCIDHWSNNIEHHVNGDASNTVDSSWKTAKTEYATPYQSFNTLIGCKMNGTWKIIVEDTWLSDDGFIFGWELGLSKRLLEANWNYLIKPDSISLVGSSIQAFSSNRAYIIPQSAGTFTYQIGVFDNLGCRYDTSINLTVYPNPEPEIGEDFSICTGEMRQLTASNMPNDATYYWNNGMTTPSIDVISGGKYTVDVTVSHLDTLYNSEFKCKGHDSIQVTVNPSPYIKFEIEGDNQCAPAELKLKNNTIFALHPDVSVNDVDATYQWYVWDENWNLYLSSTLFEPEFILENPGSYHVMLYAYTTDGCKDSLIKYSFIKIFQQPVVEFLATPESQMLFDGGIVYFHNFTDTLLLQNPNTSWYWDFGDGNVDSSAFSPEHNYETWGDYDVIFYARTEDGCSDQIVHRVIIEDNITFPNNIITPNGDGLNDVFAIGGLNTYINPDDPSKFRENRLTVHDRWGKKVYEAKNYDTYLDPVSGEIVVGKKAFGGEKCADGVYYFTFYYKGKVKTFHLNGTIMIVRETK